MLAPIYQVDAFTETPFEGNPAAIVPLEAWPEDDALLQRIAGENNLSETAFYVPAADDADADFEIRWFTPTVEVDLCGHATLAAAHVLLRHRGWPAGTVVFACRSGRVVVRAEKDHLFLDFPTRTPEPAPESLRDVIGTILGDSPRDVLAARDLLCVFDDERAVRALQPDFAALAALDCWAVIATAPADDPELDFVSRFFAPAQGVDEDPVTGSSFCTLIPYWAARLGRDELAARQISARGGNVIGRLRGERVAIGGTAITYLEGSIHVGAAEAVAAER